MRIRHLSVVSLVFVLALSCPACDWITGTGWPADPSIDAPAADGIDPKNPNVERSTKVVDFTGVRTIRLELPTGRVSITQADGNENASIKVTEIILQGGFGNDVLKELLTKSEVTAERAFVDDTRLDVQATIAEGLTHEGIVFDVRLVVPHGANIEVLLGDGPVEVGDLTGNVEIKTADGAVDIKGVKGHVIAETSGQPVNVTDATGDVRAVTTEADITLRLSPGDGAKIIAGNTAGAINVTVARTTASSLRLTSLEGAVTANLGGFAVTDISTGDGFLEGVLNGGGGIIEVDSVSGEISFAGMDAEK